MKEAGGLGDGHEGSGHMCVKVTLPTTTQRQVVKHLSPKQLLWQDCGAASLIRAPNSNSIMWARLRLERISLRSPVSTWPGLRPISEKTIYADTNIQHWGITITVEYGVCSDFYHVKETGCNPCAGRGGGLGMHSAQPQGHLKTDTTGGRGRHQPKCTARHPDAQSSRHPLLTFVPQTEMLPAQWLHAKTLTQAK